MCLGLFCRFKLGIQTVVSCSSRAEHCRPATSILCGFQATEFALHTHAHKHMHTHAHTMYSLSFTLAHVQWKRGLTHIEKCIFLACITCQPLSSGACVALKRAHSLPRQPENMTNKHHFNEFDRSFTKPRLDKRLRFCLPHWWLTSTCIHSLCFSQTSAMWSSGSNAPCTVVPDVQLTRNGTAPWKKQTETEYAIPWRHLCFIVLFALAVQDGQYLSV